MYFAEAYLQQLSLDPVVTRLDPDPYLSLVIAIPAKNEPGLIRTLQSINKCKPPLGNAEIIVSLNSSDSDTQEILEQNVLTLNEIRSFNDDPATRIRVTVLDCPGISGRNTGAGYARKLAMDHALHRFALINRKDGVIVSLDADTRCDSNYLFELEKHFLEDPNRTACSIRFEHPLEGKEFSAEVYSGITQYELHLRYYVEGLRFAGHPHAYHTLGSAFAVRAGTYAAQGGMNRRSAGEDFYFLQKIIPLGGFSELNSTCLVPSPRPSGRVAFGTGPVIKQFESGKTSELLTYNPQSFKDLKLFLEIVPKLYGAGSDIVREILKGLPEPIRTDLASELEERIREINNNSSSYPSFRKRFFRWYNMFRALKFFNYVHREKYSKPPVLEAAKEFIDTNEMENRVQGRELLLEYRKKQNRGSWGINPPRQ